MGPEIFILNSRDTTCKGLHEREHNNLECPEMDLEIYIPNSGCTIYEGIHRGVTV
jgi:hypothetical protein